jgi:hypothetical protein
MPRNTAKKTGRKGPLRDPTTGRVSGGNPGNKGGTGRPPDEFKRLMSEIASDDVALRTLRKIIANADHRHHMSAREYATTRGYGKPKETHEIEVGDKLADLIAAGLK